MLSRLREFIAGQEVDHYELKVKTGGRWQNPKKAVQQFETDIKGVDDLDEPLDRTVFENTAESEGWPAGTYAMAAKGPDGMVVGYAWRGLEIKGTEPGGSQSEFSDIEEALIDIEDRIGELDGGGRITSPSEAYGDLFDRMLSGDEMGPETVRQLRVLLAEWRAAEQDAPTTPGEFVGQLAQEQYDADDVDGAISLLDAWFQVERTGGAGGMLVEALDSGADGGDGDENEG